MKSPVFNQWLNSIIKSIYQYFFNFTHAQFWDRFEVIFTDDRRLDDMFTRRSILCMISNVIKHDQVFFFSVFGDEGLVVMTDGEEAEIISEF